MSRLFITDDGPLDNLLAELNAPCPQFVLWTKTTLKRGGGGQILEEVLEAVIRAGLAESRKEGLQYLNQLSSGHNPQNTFIAHADLAGIIHNRQFRILKKLLKSDSFGNYDPNRFYGVVSHQAIYDLATKKIPDHSLAQELRNLSMGTDNRKEPSSGLFEKVTGKQELLFEISDIFPTNGFLNEVGAQNQISEKLKSEISDLRIQAILELSQSLNWMATLSKLYPIIHEMRLRLFPIFGNHLQVLQKHQGAHADYLLLLTMLSWAAAISFYDQEQPILFREIPVLSKKSGIGGGRIDALELVTINNKRPSPAQASTLKSLTLESRASSVGQLISNLENMFGPDLSFRIIDWKFTVGDSTERGGLVQPADVIDPLSRHLSQMQRYITLANLDYYLNRPKRSKRRSAWSRNNPVKSGQIVYFLATGQPVTHEIKMRPNEQQKYFIEEVVYKLHHGRRRATVRMLNNLLLGSIVGKLGGKTPQKQTAAPPVIKDIQHLLPLDYRYEPSIQNIIDQHRQFVDQDKILEKIPKEHSTQHILHLDKLITAIQSGKIKGRVDFERSGGFINCIMPEHNDSTPSMRIDFKKGIWKCFGCGIYGFFAEDHLLAQQFSNLTFTRKIPREFALTKTISVPEEHHKIMGLAQEILKACFRHSPSEAYVISRSIDPELASKLGTGHADDNLINQLLDSYSYDKLIHYGFIGISSKITSERSLCPLLKKRGMSIEEISRKANTQVGLPYSVLSGRITFPLALEGRNTNFYGRATWNCETRYKHRKLTVEQTGVPHGAFNNKILESTHDEIIVTEGGFDALSLIQLGYPATMALIGVNNSIIIESLLRSDKNLAIALDHDNNQTGQTNTTKIIDKLKKNKHACRIRNFTSDFIQTNPEFLKINCKDYNEWLIAKTKTAP